MDGRCVEVAAEPLQKVPKTDLDEPQEHEEDGLKSESPAFF